MSDLIQHLRPFKAGNAHEVEDGMVRIYDYYGYPRIEIFARKNEHDALDALAESVVSALNAGPDREGP